LFTTTRKKTRFSEAEIATRFKPGRAKTGGRARGSLNGVVRAFIESLAESLQQSGFDGKGKNGAVGYLVWLSREHPALYVQLIGRLLPAKIEIDVFNEADEPPNYPTLEEIKEQIRKSGLPVPEAFPLIDYSLERSRSEETSQRNESEDGDVGADERNASA
jgi:hypothetical protein